MPASHTVLGAGITTVWPARQILAPRFRLRLHRDHLLCGLHGLGHGVHRRVQ